MECCSAGFSIWGISVITLVWSTKLTFIRLVQKTRQQKKVLWGSAATKSRWRVLASDSAIWVALYCRKRRFSRQCRFHGYRAVELLFYTWKLCSPGRLSETLSNKLWPYRKWHNTLVFMRKTCFPVTKRQSRSASSCDISTLYKNITKRLF